MLYRRKQHELIDWIDNGKNALLVTGARQVGKTYMIQETLKGQKCDYLYINLIESPDAISIFDNILTDGMDLFVKRLSLYADRILHKGQTIIFIDEVQQCKEFVTAIKFLVNEGSFRYVMSGSLLGVELTSLMSAPVGYLSTIHLHPMDFSEFLTAHNIGGQVIPDLRDCFENKRSIDDLIHKKIMQTFRMYLVVGGMPEAVSSYMETNDLNKVAQIHNSIAEQYKNDFTKYERREKLKLIKIYERVPAELADKCRRFIFKDIGNNVKFSRYEDSFNWLVDADVCIPVYNINEPRLPLLINKKDNLFKLFLSDIGMLSTLYGNTTKLAILNDSTSLNCGAIYENIVAQELNSHGFKPYYFDSHKQGEVDFIIEYKDKVLPIEVKSGKNYTTHSALNNILKNTRYQIDEAIVLSYANISADGPITYLPVYMTMFLHNDEPLPEIPKIWV